MQPNLRSPLARAALCFTLSSVLGTAAPAFGASSRSNVTPLVQFVAQQTVGAGIRGDLIAATDGNIYAVASTGGEAGYGSVLRITPTGTATAIHSFAGSSTEASQAYAGVIQANDGALYGTSYLGGANNLGTVYRVSLAGEYTNLFSFTNKSQGGFFPYTGLVQEPASGELFGTTLRGGTNDAGTVFKITTAGVLTSLASFDRVNGENPEGRLVLGPDGALYGTTLIGGDSNRGTIYKITTTGTLTRLFSFPALSAFGTTSVAVNDVGANPRAGLTLGADGNFYGTAYQGGQFGYGTVFKATPAGVVTVLHAFTGAPGDGAFPLSTVSQLPDGSLVGTTEQGGTFGAGTSWRIDPAGAYELLHSFSTLTIDGERPYATLTPTNGVLYGVSFADRISGVQATGGVLFREELPVNGVLPVTIAASPESIQQGATTTLTWNSSGAATCAASGSWSDAIGTSGTLTVTPAQAGIANYQLSCTDGAGVVRVAAVSVTVATPEARPVDAGSDGSGGGAFPFLGFVLLGGSLAFSLARKHFSTDAA